MHPTRNNNYSYIIIVPSFLRTHILVPLCLRAKVPEPPRDLTHLRASSKSHLPLQLRLRPCRPCALIGRPGYTPGPAPRGGVSRRLRTRPSGFPICSLQAGIGSSADSSFTFVFALRCSMGPAPRTLELFYDVLSPYSWLGFEVTRGSRQGCGLRGECRAGHWAPGCRNSCGALKVRTSTDCSWAEVHFVPLNGLWL